MDRRSPWLVWDKVEEDIPDGSYDFYLAVQKKKKISSMISAEYIVIVEIPYRRIRSDGSKVLEHFLFQKLTFSLQEQILACSYTLDENINPNVEN